MKLYEINEEMAEIEAEMEEWAIEHDGDITEFPLRENLEDLEEERDKKLLNVACWIKNLRSDSAALKAEEATLAKRRKAIDNKRGRLEQYLTYALPDGQKMEDSRCKLSWRKSQSVLLHCDPEALPECYQKVTVSAKKSEIKAALKAGTLINHAELIDNLNLQVK